MPKQVNLDLDLIKQYWETTPYSMIEIAQFMGTKYDNIRSRIIKHNFIRPNNLVEECETRRINKMLKSKIENGTNIGFTKVNVDVDKINELHKQGKSVSDIAKELNLTYDIVNRRLSIQDTRISIRKVDIKSICGICGKEFLLSYSQKKTYEKNPNNKFFCSLECKTKNNINNQTREKPKLTCYMCGCDVKVTKDRLLRYSNNKDKFFCSRHCTAKYVISNTDFKDRLKKSINTMKINGTFNKSSYEDKLYELLVYEFGLENVVRQYTQDGYSFDFKITRPSTKPNCNEIITQFIEVHGSYFHNKRPFIECKEHLDEYNDMITSGGKQENIAHKWRYTDVKKFNYCKENKLNYICIYIDGYPKPYFTKEQLNSCFKHIKNMKCEYYTNISRFNEIVFNYCYSLIYKDNIIKLQTDSTLYPYLINRIKYAGNYGEGQINMTTNKLIVDFNKSGNILNGFTMHPISNIKKFIIDKNITSIGDPFAGWGHRMLGSASLNIPYIGCDINKEQVINLNNIIMDFKLKHSVILNDDSLDVNIDLYNYDGIFTCPPYWNKELYTSLGIENLSYNEYKTKLINILKHWYKPSVKYIAIQFTEMYEDIMSELGEFEKIIINQNKHHLTKHNKKYNECIYIFKTINI